MDIVQFGMKSTLIQFIGQYFIYQGAAKGKDLSDKDVALAIGAYKSAFLANIVASYIFEEMDKCFENFVFRGIYRDNDYLQFTTKLGQPPPANVGNSFVKKVKKEMGVMVIHSSEFLFLDMRMHWDVYSGEMRFLVFRKPNK
eukprot:4820868-Ditylum_brightwellii.AAC.1